MDNKKPAKRSDRLRSAVKTGLERKRKEKWGLLIDAAIFAAAFFFAKCHIVFGAYPLGIALVATLPSRVIIAAIGAAVGSLTLGAPGVIYAILVPLTVCLRVLLGSPSGESFREPYVTRVACGAISSALGGLYEMLSNSLSLASVLFCAAGVLLSVGISFSFYGVFSSGVSVREALFGEGGIGRREGDGRAELWIYRGSFAVIMFFVSLSLSAYSFFGISFSYVFAAAATLFIAARFDGVAAAVVGFMTGLAGGASGAVSFALAGAAAGFLFTVGAGYALVGGGIALSAWGAIFGGAAGVLSVFPEYGATAIAMLPLLKSVRRTQTDEESPKRESNSSEMVSAAVKTYGNDSREVEESLVGIAAAVRAFSEGEGRVEFEEYRNIIIALASRLGDTPCEENIDALASKLYKGARVSEEDVARLLGTNDAAIYNELMRLVGECERECYMSARTEGVIGEYEHICRMLAQQRYRIAREREEDTDLTARLTARIREFGIKDGAAAVVGRRQRCIIAAGEDDGGKEISSAKLKNAISECVGAALCGFEYYKKDNTALMKCYTEPRYEVEYAVSQSASDRTGVSGDTAVIFENDGAFYSVISDGMGSGESARKTSRFVAEYLRHSLLPDTPSAKEAVGSLSGLLRGRREECAATADIFSFDVYTGECRFLKCGAAPSYIVRGDSVFAVRASSAPIGIMRGVDAEEMMAEVRAGDTVVMMSDGVAPIPDEAVWLIEFLARPTKLSAGDYASEILRMAKERGGGSDDITVTVLRIDKKISEISA